MPEQLTAREWKQRWGSDDSNRMSVARSLVVETIFVIGALLLSFAFYQAYWTNLEAGDKQAAASDTLTAQWKNPRSMQHPELGDAFARMYIPAFGADYQFSIVEGVADADLEIGPGHYPDSQMPGEKGNFAVAGHRVGTGAPFNDLGKLKTCDAIVVETKTEWFTYRVLPMDGEPRRAECVNPQQQENLDTGQYSQIVGRHITTPEDVSVVDKVPGHKDGDEIGMESLITLTTCHPQFSAAERMIIHGMEVERIDKSTGKKPAALEAEVA